MAPTIQIEIHNVDTHIEDENLPWYLVNTFIDPDTGYMLKYKYIIQQK